MLKKLSFDDALSIISLVSTNIKKGSSLGIAGAWMLEPSSQEIMRRLVNSELNKIK